MSTISRRDFMKTAGVMTLAVAASGVLAGCSTEEEVKPVVAGTLTVGDYTVSVAGTKLYNYYKVASADDVSKNTAVEAQYLVVYLTGTTTKTKDPEFNASDIKVVSKNLRAADITKIAKDEFSSKIDVTSGSGLFTAFGDVKVTEYTIENGFKAWVALEVDPETKTLTEGDVPKFKTPSLTLYSQKDNVITGSYTVTIPAAEAAYTDGKKIAV